jgi:hypothetical protein
MKTRILGITATLLGILAALLVCLTGAQAANYQAAAGGDWHTTNTWNALTVPGAGDNVDLNGKAITLTNTVTVASLVDVATGGSLDLGAGVTFTCRAVTNAPLTTSAAGVVVDCDVVNTTIGNGLTIAAGGEVTIQGTWDNSGSGYGVYNNGGTVTDFSGTLNNSGGFGVYNFTGTVTDFSGTLNNSGSGYGAFNNVTWTDFSGTLNNDGSGSGVLNNIGGNWTGFSGILALGSTAATAIEGAAIPFSGTIKIAAQADLSAANIRTGKTILGTTGTLTPAGPGFGGGFFNQ